MQGYKVQDNPFVVPTVDGKLIEEHFGMASINTGDYSLAHMIAPPQWSEPAQTPDFDETTLVISGRMKFQIGGKEIVLGKGQSIFVGKGTKVQYSNPFPEPAEYVSLCIPAFTPERAHREEK